MRFDRDNVVNAACGLKARRGCGKRVAGEFADTAAGFKLLFEDGAGDAEAVGCELRAAKGDGVGERRGNDALQFAVPVENEDTDVLRGGPTQRIE